MYDYDNIPEHVKGEIYLMTCIVTNKHYVGQTRTHYKNGNTYKKFGHKGRFNAHINEALSNTKKECPKLNRAIRKHGKDNFKVKLILTCELIELDHYETYYIEKYDSINNGYNATYGGRTGFITEEICKNISNTLNTQFDNKKYEKIKDIDIKKIKLCLVESDNRKTISLYINDCIKFDFGKHPKDLKSSLERAEKFALNIANNKQEDIIVQDKLEQMTSLKNYKKEDKLVINSKTQVKYNDQKRYDKYSNIDITSISIKLNKTPQYDLILLFIKSDNKTDKLSFGGKILTFDQNINRIKIFLEKINYNIDNIIYITKKLEPYFK